jgi:hypothetical protein
MEHASEPEDIEQATEQQFDADIKDLVAEITALNIPAATQAVK